MRHGRIRSRADEGLILLRFPLGPFLLRLSRRWVVLGLAVVWVGGAGLGASGVGTPEIGANDGAAESGSPTSGEGGAGASVADDPLIEASRRAVQTPLSPEKAEKILTTMGENWLYGQGVGTTALNLGAIYLFPPYALYVLGNSVLAYSGYEPVYVSHLLPEQDKKQFERFYDNFTSAPGRVNAALAGKEFRTKEAIRDRLQSELAPHGGTDAGPAADPEGARGSTRPNDGATGAVPGGEEPPPTPAIP